MSDTLARPLAVDTAPAIALTLNGRAISAAVPLGARLSAVLRETLGAREVKIGCNAGDCGACTVLLDGAPVCACLVSAGQAAGRSVETVVGVRADPAGAALGEAFLRHGAAQCGICTPGMLVAGAALLRHTPAPDEAAVRDALAGVLCRCTGYRKIIDAVMDVAGSGPATGSGAVGEDVARLDGRPRIDGTAPAAGSSALGERAVRLDGRPRIDGTAPVSGAVAERVVRLDGRPGIDGTAPPAGSSAVAERAVRLDGPPRIDGTAPPAGSGAVGQRVVRLDGRPKIDGTEAFGDDVAPAGALHVKIVRSPHPHARIVFGDLDGFASRHGLAAILTARDIPGRNSFGVIPQFADQPVFAETEARYRGEAVAALVGEAEAIAAITLADVPIDFEPLPAVLSPQAAEAAGAPRLHTGRANNVLCRGLVRRGDAEAALARADVVAEGTFTTPFVEHAYIEPEAGTAWLVDGRIEVHASTQAPAMDRDSLAEILALPVSAVRIVPTACGGGFGSKLDLSVQPFIALAALRTGRPARIAYSRTESMQSTTKRHPATITARIGATRDGRLCGFRFDGTFDTGAYASWGPTVATRVPVHASGPYAVADYTATSVAVHTHNPPAGAFRGFGVPQSAIAQEVLFQDLADQLGIDGLEFRHRNALANGVATVCGQVFAQGVGIRACFDALRPHWARALADAAAANAVNAGPLRRGVGIAGAWYGCGNTGMANPSTIKAGIAPDGRIVLHQGATDIGQGANTVIAQIFAAALGVPLGAIALVGPDTDLTPDAGKTSASRQTFISGNAAKRAGEALRAAVLRHANAGPDATIVPGDSLVVVEGGRQHRVDLTAPPGADGYVLGAEERYDPPTSPLDSNGQGAPYAVYGYAAHIAELAVDTALGTVHLIKFTAAHDVGRAINPTLIEGQVHGGIAQGLGMALMEAYLPGRTENLHDYLIPTIGDMPPVETLIVEEADAHGPFGAKGLGEHVLIPTAPAILNAIRHATGARLTAVPATPDRVLAALRAMP